MITHSHFSLKSNSDMAIPNAWKRFRGCRNQRAKVFSSILPKMIRFGAVISSFSWKLLSIRMKFFIDACFTLPPKLRAYDLSRSFHRGCLFLRLMTVGGWKLLRLSSSVSLYISKSSTSLTLGITALNFLGPFMPRKLLQYSMYAIDTLNLDLFISLLGCRPLSQSWQIDPAALPRSLPRQEGLFLSISLVRLMQQLQPMQPRWFSQKRIGRWSSPITWQSSLKPLWQRLKQTKECSPCCRGVQMAILRSCLLKPALPSSACISTQFSNGFLDSFFSLTIWSIAYCQFGVSSSDSSCSWYSCFSPLSCLLKTLPFSSTVTSEKVCSILLGSLCSSVMSSSELIIAFFSLFSLFPRFLSPFFAVLSSFFSSSCLASLVSASSTMSSSPKSMKLFWQLLSLFCRMFSCSLCESNLSSCFSSILVLYQMFDSSITPISFSSSLSINFFGSAWRRKYCDDGLSLRSSLVRKIMFKMILFNHRFLFYQTRRCWMESRQSGLA